MMKMSKTNQESLENTAESSKYDPRRRPSDLDLPQTPGVLSAARYEIEKLRGIILELNHAADEVYIPDNIHALIHKLAFRVRPLGHTTEEGEQ